MRFGAALADFSTQNFFSAGLFANILRQDPRYFRMGPSAGILKRVGYSISRLVVARQDSGASAFNASNFLGMSVGIEASNAYYPSSSRTGTVMGSGLVPLSREQSRRLPRARSRSASCPSNQFPWLRGAEKRVSRNPIDENSRG
jgi:hypothetical protein